MPEPTDVYLDLPPDEDQRIQRLYCWVAIQPDGSEGIPSMSVDGHTMPLVTSKRRVADLMSSAAVDASEAAKAAGKPVRLELRVFDLARVLHRG
jgi:hypothetical protein